MPRGTDVVALTDPRTDPLAALGETLYARLMRRQPDASKEEQLANMLLQGLTLALARPDRALELLERYLPNDAARAAYLRDQAAVFEATWPKPRIVRLGDPT